MQYKTPMVAEKLGVSPKVVMRIVQQLDLSLQKNKFGHYVFSESDVQQIIDYHKTSEAPETSETFPAPAPQQSSSYVTIEEFSSLKQHMQQLGQRLSHNEDKMRGKADDVVNYQLLQHRSEIEELQQKIKTLEVIIERLEARNSYAAPVRDLSAGKVSSEKPKRRKMILNIFGF